MKRAVILLSGGLDSATTLYFALSKGHRLAALIFDYGQRHAKEIACARKIARLNKVAYQVVKINLPWTQSSLTKAQAVPQARNLKSRVIPSTYVAGRNIVFLSYAFSLAESIGAEKIFIGVHVQDYSGYPDCRPEFMRKFEAASRAGLKNKKITIATPLINKTKLEIIKLGLKLGVPFQYTWSCYQGTKRPCGRCDSCRFRLKAFRQLGRKDPLLRFPVSGSRFARIHNRTP